MLKRLFDMSTGISQPLLHCARLASLPMPSMPLIGFILLMALTSCQQVDSQVDSKPPAQTNNATPLQQSVSLDLSASNLSSAALSPAALQSLVQWQLNITPTAMRKGEQVRVKLTASIADGWYVYALTPAQGKFAPKPTLPQINHPALQPAKWQETTPLPIKDKVFKRALPVHKQRAHFYGNTTVNVHAPLGVQRGTVSIRYQACNERYCTPLRTHQQTLALTLEAGSIRAAYQYPDQSIESPPYNKSLAFLYNAEQALPEGNTLTFLVVAFLLGLLALFTPCVLPMIPITLAYFSVENTESVQKMRWRNLTPVLCFGLGVAGITTAIGAVTSFLLGAGGASRFATHPLTSLLIGIGFALFSLQLMGIGAIALPQGLIQKSQHWSHNRRRLPALFLMGAAFSLTSFTCTMPFLGTLLLPALIGASVWWPLLGMLTFTAGFVAPFLLFALLPDLMRRLPSGKTVLRFRLVLGILEWLAVWKLISNADVIWEWGLFTRESVLILSMLTLCVAIWGLMAKVPWLSLPAASSTPKRWVALSVLVYMIGYFGWGAAGNRLDAMTESLLPFTPVVQDQPFALQAGISHSQPLSTNDKPFWHNSLKQALQAAQQRNQPLFIDFSGYNCINCRWMEEKMFHHPATAQFMQRHFVLVRLYTDGGKNAKANQQLQITRFGTIALPYYAVISPSQTLLAKHAGIFFTVKGFNTWLQETQQRYEHN